MEGFDRRGLTFEVGKGFWESRPLPHRIGTNRAAAFLSLHLDIYNSLTIHRPISYQLHWPHHLHSFIAPCLF